jgi:hypothetical protein
MTGLWQGKDVVNLEQCGKKASEFSKISGVVSEDTGTSLKGL